MAYNAGNSRISQLRFDPFGARFGACDSQGDLYLWKFDSSPHSLMPYKSFNCHSTVAHDFSFLNSGTVLATAGLSLDYGNVCIWDSLLPSSKSKIKCKHCLIIAFAVNETGSHSIAHSQRHNLIFAGGKRGDLAIIDIRQRSLIVSFSAHAKTIKSLCVDGNGTLISGSADGLVKVWDISSMMSLVPTIQASPSTFNSSLISRTVTTSPDAQSVVQIVKQNDGSIIVSDCSGLRKVVIN